MSSRPSSIWIGHRVHYSRLGAYSFDGTVLTLHEGTNRALVQWVDCLGQVRQTLVGVEFLTSLVPNKQTAEAVAPAAAS